MSNPSIPPAQILALFSSASAHGIKPCELLAMLTCELARNGIAVHISDVMSSTGMGRQDALDTMQSLLNRGYTHHEDFSYHLSTLGESKLHELNH